MRKKASAVKVATRYLLAKLPPGWTEESVKKWMGTMTGDVKHPVKKCIKKMEGKVEDPGALCARYMDIAKGTTKWRGKKK